MNTYVKNGIEVFKIRDQEITIESDFCFDLETDEKVFDETLDNIAINKAFDIYRENNNILSKEKFKAIRNKYQLSQREFAELTGISKASISRYEKGAIPTKVNNNIYIDLDENVDKMLEMLNRNEKKVDINITKKLKVRIEELKEVNESNEFKIIENLLLKTSNDVENGFKILDLLKIESVIKYFEKHMTYISKTKLNKLLFYCDFIYFKKNTCSLTGIEYIKDYYGPVPKKSEYIYGLLVEEGKINWIPFPNGQGEYICCSDIINEDINDKEKEILDKVIELFEKDNANEISEKSHEETAWLETEFKNIIPYSYATDLKYI
ncbi:type II toxin-antitoxin system antitoxin SocA domain-containing protein [Staphylococcus equorum]|uniref:type II toxin-antitoxin system antitoxin SocA domain-containing protein n=1 Tax=Staphylococcus equorum TaxID=246432 RepID=UPI00209EAAB8|nr:type II toxin-antitoxin system antitoxin SocA domain-containing protein [Staphylococcus equorum]